MPFTVVEKAAAVDSRGVVSLTHDLGCLLGNIRRENHLPGDTLQVFHGLMTMFSVPGEKQKSIP